MNNQKTGPVARIARALSLIEPNEFKATVFSFLFVFNLMAAYFIVRPYRDAIASEWDRVETASLWSMTFAVSVVAVSIYAFAISRIRFSLVLPSVYIFFGLSFAAFYLGSSLLPDPILIEQSFYVWLSVFSLFHVSVFWSFTSSVFNGQQAKRLFPVIATGASLGAMVGPVIPAFFQDSFGLQDSSGLMNLLLITAAMQLVPLPLIRKLDLLKSNVLGNAGREADLSDAKRLGRNPFSGFMLVVRNPYLRMIALFIVMYVTMSTFVYMELREGLAIFDRGERTAIYARIDFVVNTLAVIGGLFLTGRAVLRFGAPAVLAAIPVLMIGGWFVVAAIPLLVVLYGLSVARRAGNYAVTKPAREMLFTVVNDETRYKAKPVLDMVIYRGGDMASAWIHTGLRELLALSTSGVAIVGAIIAAFWAGTGFYLGRAYNRRLDENDPAAAADAVPRES